MERYKEYCTGCGLCKAVNDVNFEIDDKGFNIPILKEKDRELCSTVCLASKNASKRIYSKNIWGDFNSVFLGWSNNKEIRENASSGGVLTSLCCYLLESGKVDGIIQTTVGDKIYETKTIVSHTTEEVCNCLGSRYSISSPLENILNLLEEGKKYAFVGKPCDVTSLKLYMENNTSLSNSIIYTLSFFCAGQPSLNAQKKLLKALDCANEEECISLRYRGNGWPGYATVQKIDGKCNKISYNESWSKILGRDVRKSCRFCIDGIGSLADISCGDAWYLLKNNKPDFSEHKGRNIVFSRTRKGETLLNDAVQGGFIHTEEYKELNNLKLIQKYQFERRSTMFSMILAIKISLKKSPFYSFSTLLSFSKNVGVIKQFKRFSGTIKRIINKKI